MLAQDQCGSMALTGQRRPHVRILVPITSEGFRGDSVAQTFAGADFDVSSAFLKSGPVSVESAIDEALAGPGLISAAIAAEGDGADSIVIDCMLDPALDALREAVAIPVVGCGEANMRAAAKGGRFSIVTVLDRQERLFRQKARLYGVEEALVSVRSIAVPVLDLNADRNVTVARTVQASVDAARKDDIQAIVFGCTGMLGLGEPLGEALKAYGLAVSVYDPLPYAVVAAAEMVVNGVAHSKGDYPYPERKGFDGLSDWPNLAALLKASGAGR